MQTRRCCLSRGQNAFASTELRMETRCRCSDKRVGSSEQTFRIGRRREKGQPQIFCRLSEHLVHFLDLSDFAMDLDLKMDTLLSGTVLYCLFQTSDFLAVPRLTLACSSGQRP
mmetsp:Transcript_639/g.1182  ORF Transcript_639/g.1182 Transcript_639/m.1182 type:complete len:113 (-) Transcript_639:53-391(-)